MMYIHKHNIHTIRYRKQKKIPYSSVLNTKLCIRCNKKSKNKVENTVTKFVSVQWCLQLGVSW